MKLKTYNKRFDLPVHFLSILFNAIIKARNGQWYNVTLNKKGEPVARNINDQFKILYGGDLYQKPAGDFAAPVRPKVRSKLQAALLDPSATKNNEHKPIPFT